MTLHKLHPVLMMTWHQGTVIQGCSIRPNKWTKGRGLRNGERRRDEGREGVEQGGERVELRREKRRS